MSAQTRDNPPLDPTWAADLCHPVPMAAVWVLALNDHWLKGAGLLPGAVTGKLSDVVGLFFFPMLLVAVVQGLGLLLGRDTSPARRGLVWGAVLATGVFFTGVKLWAPLNAWVAGWWGVMVMDPTDLWTLPVLVGSLLWMGRGR